MNTCTTNIIQQFYTINNSIQKFYLSNLTNTLNTKYQDIISKFHNIITKFYNCCKYCCTILYYAIKNMYSHACMKIHSYMEPLRNNMANEIIRLFNYIT